MVRIAVNGALGRMGGEVIAQAVLDPSFTVVAGIDPGASSNSELGCQLLPDIAALTESVDVIVDFSSPAALPALLRYATTHGVPLVLGTTGFSASDKRKIEDAALLAPVFMSPNMSYGVAVLADLARQAVKALGGFDVEISEAHHRRKVDAPSGTALMLYSAADDALPYSPAPVYDRHENRAKRDKHEIGLHAVRGGTIVGEHEVVFAGHHETVTLSHSAGSREVFASGALRAALYMAGVSRPGRYDMKNLLNS